MKDESRPEAALVNSAVAAGSSPNSTVEQLLNGAIHPHELPWELWLLWADGFHAGCHKMQARVDRLNREADDLWFQLHNPADVRAERDKWLRHFDVVQARKTGGAR